jgi:hypothetical protein
MITGIASAGRGLLDQPDQLDVVLEVFQRRQEHVQLALARLGADRRAHHGLARARRRRVIGCACCATSAPAAREIGAACRARLASASRASKGSRWGSPGPPSAVSRQFTQRQAQADRRVAGNQRDAHAPRGAFPSACCTSIPTTVSHASGSHQPTGLSSPWFSTRASRTRSAVRWSSPNFCADPRPAAAHAPGRGSAPHPPRPDG